MRLFTQITLSFCLTLCLSVSLSAQTWTATDTNGDTHDIQAYLDNGVTVLVDLSAHWCGPCWAWHQGGVMEKAYHEFGPDGTGDLMVLFIDGSNNPPSDMNLLSGIGNTQGNWFEGTGHPIIGPNGQGQLVAGSYTFGGFPTLFTHCPGSTTAVEIQRADYNSFMSTWRGQCGAPFDNGSDDATLFRLDDSAFCAGESPLIELYNQGSNTLTSARIELNDGTSSSFFDWTGNLASGASQMVELSSFTLTSDITITATVIEVNGLADNTAGNSEVYNYTVAPDMPTKGATFNITLDNYGSETTWRIKDDMGATIASGGPYTDGTNGTTYTENLWLTGAGCYSVEVFDAYGDGICCSYGNGGYELLDANGTAIVTGGSFGAAKTEYFRVDASVSVGEVVSPGSLNVFPNPVQDNFSTVFSLESESKIQIGIYNSLGQFVKAIASESFGAGEHLVTGNTSDLSNGVYFITLTSDEGSISKRITVSH